MSLNKKRAVTLIIIAVFTVIDQLIKSTAVKNLKDHESITVIKGVLGLRYLENTGAAFGSMRNMTVLLSVVTAIVVVAALGALLSGRIKSNLLYCAVTCVVSGGIGNLIDRISRGYVVDMFEFLFVDFAVFNFADCLVSIGAVAMLAYLFADFFKDKRKKRKTE